MENNNTQKTEKKSSKVVNIIVDIVLVLAIIFAFICSYSAFEAKKGSGVPDLFGIRFFSVQSDSMDPTFCKGDMVIGGRPDVAKIQPGDIITFRTNEIFEGQTVFNSHRVIEIKNADDLEYIRFVVEGDNPLAKGQIDEVAPNNIVSVYKTHVKNLGKAFDFLQSKEGFFIIIVLPVGIFFIWQLVQFFRALFAYQAEKIRIQYQNPNGESKEDTDKEEE